MTNDKRPPREWYLCEGSAYPCEDFTLEQVTAEDGEYCDTLIAVVVEKSHYAALKADADKLAAALGGALTLATEVLTLTHQELSGCEMDTLTTRQYAIFSRSGKLEAANAALADWRAKWGTP